MSPIPATLVLENERVMLRLLKEEDVDHLLPFALHEPDLWHYALFSAAGRRGMEGYIEMAVKDFDSETAFPFIVFDKEAGQYAGCTRFYDIQPHHKTLQIGYTWYGKKFQGTGLNKNCKYLLLQYAFETLQMERVEFRADAKNERSIAAMRAIGCTAEGILRSHLFTHDNKRRNSIILSILKQEWFGGTGQRLLTQTKNLL